MNFTARELRLLILPVLACLALLAAGAALVSWTQDKRLAAKREIETVRAEGTQARQRLMRIAEEEREVKDKLEVYMRLKRLGIIGEERRLEWADAMTRIRTQRELPDLRYRVERQRQISSVAGKPAGVDFFASAMNVSLALLHEGDLLAFLQDLRVSGNAFYAVKNCAVSRTGFAPAGASLAPRLHAECEIDLITIVDRAAKS
jgi:hypothetical protein